jgi:hypothetical protein
MGRKRKTSESDVEDAYETEKENEEYRNKQQQQKKKTVEIVPSMIRNKERRSEVHAKLKHQKKLEKRKKIQARDAAEKRALELGEEVPCLFFFFLFLFSVFRKLNCLFWFVNNAASAKECSSYDREHQGIR